MRLNVEDIFINLRINLLVSQRHISCGGQRSYDDTKYGRTQRSYGNRDSYDDGKYSQTRTDRDRTDRTDRPDRKASPTKSDKGPDPSSSTKLNKLRLLSIMDFCDEMKACSVRGCDNVALFTNFKEVHHCCAHRHDEDITKPIICSCSEDVTSRDGKCPRCYTGDKFMCQHCMVTPDDIDYICTLCKEDPDRIKTAYCYQVAIHFITKYDLPMDHMRKSELSYRHPDLLSETDRHIVMIFITTERLPSLKIRDLYFRYSDRDKPIAIIVMNPGKIGRLISRLEKIEKLHDIYNRAKREMTLHSVRVYEIYFDNSQTTESVTKHDM